MFRGLTKLNLDNKGRLVMPARHRAALPAGSESRVVVTLDRARCLVMYPMPEWSLVEAQFTRIGMDPKVVALKRLVIGHAEELDIDGAGRVLLPPVLREIAHLDKTVMMVGQGNKLEIWSEADWAQERDRTLELPVSDWPADMNFVL
jgi:MraZ protein